MASDTKPMLKYSSDDYSTRSNGVHNQGLRAQMQMAMNVVRRSWARAVKIVRMREVFAEFLATFALVVGEGGIEHS